VSSFVERYLWVFGPVLTVPLSELAASLGSRMTVVDAVIGALVLGALVARWREGPGVPNAEEASSTLAGDLTRRQYVGWVGGGMVVVWILAHVGGAYFAGEGAIAGR
jgi:hypothetical protein